MDGWTWRFWCAGAGKERMMMMMMMEGEMEREMEDRARGLARIVNGTSSVNVKRDPSSSTIL